MAEGASVGSLEWTRLTRGLLRRRDRLALVGQAVLYGITTLPAEVRRALGITRRGLAPVDAAVLEPPDSSVCREAEQLVADTTPPMVANHSHRTFAWAAALAAHDRLPYDREVVYVASLLHDLYFARPVHPPAPQCFTLPAANELLAVADRAGWEPRRAGTAAEAITLHANVRPPRQSNEAYLVYAGSRLDVIGYRHGHLHQETVTQIVARHPRLDMKRQSPPLFEGQAAANPGTRIAFLTRFVGANWFMSRAPFDE